MHAVNVIWELSCSPRSWLGVTQALPDIDRQFSLCFPLMQTMIEHYNEIDESITEAEAKA